MSLSPAFVLSVGEDGALLTPPRSLLNTPPLFAPAPDAPEAEALWQALAKAPRAPLLLLADTLAQEFKRETLPQLNPFDRGTLIARRLAQTFPKTEWRGAISERGGAVLLASLDEQSPVRLWHEALKAKGRAAFLVLLPLESASLPARLAPRAAEGQSLFLAPHRVGGFRQIVTDKGGLVFTRLTPPPMPMASADTIAETLAQEIQATQSYLARQGLGEGKPLSLIALLPAHLHEAFARQALHGASLHLFTPEDAAKKLGQNWPVGADKTAADSLHALWLQAKARPALILERPAERRARRENHLRKTGTFLATLALVAALGFAGQEGFALWRLRQTTLATAQNIAALKQRMTNSREALLQEAASLDLLRKAVERRRFFAARRETFEAFFPGIDAALGPEARLVALEMTPDRLSFDLRLTDDGLDDPPDTLSQQEMTRRFEAIAARLRETLPEAQVTMTRTPYPSQPNETITNKRDKAARVPPVASFVLTLRGQ